MQPAAAYPAQRITYAAMYRNVDTILFLSKEPKNEKNLEME